MIHIVIGDSAAGSVKLALHNTLDSYIALPPGFGEGPLKDLLTNEGLSERIEWFTKNYQQDWAFYGDMTEMAIEAIDELIDEEITVWTANNASERFGLSLVCYLLQRKHCKIYIVNTSDSIGQLTANKMSIRHTGELSAELIQQMMTEKMRRLLTRHEVHQLALQAEKLMASDAVLRRYQEGNIVELAETHDDALILQYAKNYQQQVEDEYFKAIRLIGEIFGHEESMLSDAWIDYRIRTLVKEDKLCAIGNLNEIHMYHIKVKS